MMPQPSGFGQETWSFLASIKKRVEDLHEFNPMLGIADAAWGLYSEVTEMQAQAILEAAILVKKTG